MAISAVISHLAGSRCQHKGSKSSMHGARKEALRSRSARETENLGAFGSGGSDHDLLAAWNAERPPTFGLQKSLLQAAVEMIMRYGKCDRANRSITSTAFGVTLTAGAE
jgi:hypothetical protein